MENNKGVYVGMLVAQESERKLLDFFERIGLSLVDSYNKIDNRLHSTIIYSKIGCAKKVDLNKTNIKVNPYKWDTLTSALTGNTCLVLSLDTVVMEEIHYQIKNRHNLNHEFEGYHPHISIHYNFNGNIPSELPNFEIELDNIFVRDLIII
jgi:hypothetical protein